MMRELRSLANYWKQHDQSPDRIFMKLHPSVKFKMFFRIYLKLFFSKIKEEKRYIEDTLEDYTQLYTVNSTLLLDFLLAGKKVLLSDRNILPDEIVDCCISLENPDTGDSSSKQKKNAAILELLGQNFNISTI